MEMELTMPKLSPKMEKGILCAWMKAPGDHFEQGEPIYEVETEKVVSMVEAPVSGILKELLVEEGDEVDVGAPLAVIQ